mgnify:CR=1 FL=1
MRPVHTRHEQTTAYMALGAALATGKPQAYCVVPGPGFLNTTTPLATAQSLCAPVLALSGQIYEQYIGKGIGFLHEIWHVILISTITGLGVGFAYAAMPTLIMRAVPPTETAAANDTRSSSPMPYSVCACGEG